MLTYVLLKKSPDLKIAGDGENLGRSVVYTCLHEVCLRGGHPLAWSTLKNDICNILPKLICRLSLCQRQKSLGIFAAMV